MYNSSNNNIDNSAERRIRGHLGRPSGLPTARFKRGEGTAD